MGAPKARHILGFTQQSAIRWFAPAKRLSSAVLLPAVVSGNPIGRARGRCDEVEMPEATMDGRTDGRMDGWMHWNEVLPPPEGDGLPRCIFAC